MSAPDFDTIPDTNALEVAINAYFAIFLVFFLSFTTFFAYQYYSKFYSTSILLPSQVQSGIGGSLPKTEIIARKVGILKILIALFGALCWITMLSSVFDPSLASCNNGWKISCTLYVSAKFLVYAFLFQRGELVSVGPKTNFETAIQFATLAVPPLGVVGSIVGGGEFLSGICYVSMPSWYTVLIIITDAGLSCGYLLMFLLKLRNLERNLKMFRPGRKSTTESKDRSNDKKNIELSREQAQADDSLKAPADDSLKAPADDSLRAPETPHRDELNVESQDIELGVASEDPTHAEAAPEVPPSTTELSLHPREGAQPDPSAPPTVRTMTPSTSNSNFKTKTRSTRSKSQKIKEENIGYRKIMKTHTRITAITCTSTLICMLLFVLANALEVTPLLILTGPITGLDLVVNVLAIAYVTRGSQK